MFIFSNPLDKLAIFICCLVVYLCQADIGIGVGTVLVGIIFSGLLSYFDDGRLKTILTAGFSILSCFMPALTFFLPLIAYDMLFYKYQYVNLSAVIPLLLFFRSASVQIASIVTVLLLLGILVRYRAESHARLYLKYNELSDTTREMTLQLKKQNRELIEKQDNERNLAALNERNRIAREIHDNVGHLLSSAILQAGALLTINRDEKVGENLKTLKDTLSQAMNNIRTSVHELYDESIDLNSQIENLVRQFTFCEISYDFHISGNPGKKLKYAFISIVKEALSNIMKHSNATRASVSIREHPAFYQLIVRDNGKVKSYSMDDGLGLKNIIERVHSFNGYVNIITEKGFEIFITIPKEDIQN